MQFDKKTLTVCVLAAASSALLGMALWLSLAGMQLFIFLFGFFVSLPILIVAFGYGTGASMFSAVLGTFFLLFSLPSVAALLIALFFFAPSLFAGWLMGLAQPGSRKDTVVWYPLSQTVFLLALAIVAATIIVMLYLLSSAEVMQHLDGFIDQFIVAVREINLYPATDQALFEKAIRAQFIPGIASVFAVYGLLFHLGNLYFSTRLAKKLGRLNRPLDNWPAALRMPMAALVIFGIGGLATLFPVNETLTICANIIVSALGVGFFASGLAFIHHVTQGRPWRIAVLMAIYIGLFTLVLTPFLVMALIITGLFSTFLSLRRNDKT